MEYLIDFFDRYIRGHTEALICDDGFRRWSYSGDEVRATAEAFAGRLAGVGLRTGDRLLIWSDSRPEWVAAFWACMLCGVAVIPLDAAASPELVGRIIRVAAPHSILIGDGLQVGQLPPSMCVWRLRDIRWINASTTPALHNGAETRADFSRARVGPHTVAEIVFTSETTGEPKGVVLTHRNILANITPVEREVRAFRRYLWPFRPIRFLSLVPLSHIFGQALAIFFPPLVNAATVFMTGYNPDHVRGADLVLAGLGDRVGSDRTVGVVQRRDRALVRAYCSLRDDRVTAHHATAPMADAAGRRNADRRHGLGALAMGSVWGVDPSCARHRGHVASWYTTLDQSPPIERRTARQTSVRQ